MSESVERDTARRELEILLGADLRRLTSEGDRITRSFAAAKGMAANDLRALLVVVMADLSERRLTAGHLRKRMGLSAAAISYIVERLVGSGYIVRDVDPTDRRKVIVRPRGLGMDVARALLREFDGRSNRALEGLSEADLRAAHRTFSALMAAMTAFGAELAE